jgi:hypothetical protein
MPLQRAVPIVDAQLLSIERISEASAVTIHLVRRVSRRRRTEIRTLTAVLGVAALARCSNDVIADAPP